MNSKDDGEIRALLGEKLSPTTGESEGAEGRLVILKEPIAIDVLEKRIKTHLKLSQSLFVSSPLISAPRVLSQFNSPSSLSRHG